MNIKETAKIWGRSLLEYSSSWLMQSKTTGVTISPETRDSWIPYFLDDCTDEEKVEWDAMLMAGMTPERIWQLLTNRPGFGELHHDPFHRIAAECGWLPLTKGETMKVHFGERYYVVKRVK